MIDLNGKLRQHAQLRHSLVHVGAEGMPVLIVDNFLNDAQILVDYAAQARPLFKGVSDAFYPGVNTAAPQIYCFALRAFLGNLIESAFGLPARGIAGESSGFSMINTPAHELSVTQCLAHADNTNPKQLALLHYLCRAQHGGTSFYRHRRTRFEYINTARLRAFQAATEEDMREFGLPPRQYLCGDDVRFERTASFDAVFNRVLIYQSINLHSANIAPDFHPDDNPRTGRLTLNTFFYYN